MHLAGEPVRARGRVDGREEEEDPISCSGKSRAMQEGTWNRNAFGKRGGAVCGRSGTRHRGSPPTAHASAPLQKLLTCFDQASPVWYGMLGLGTAPDISPSPDFLSHLLPPRPLSSHSLCANARHVLHIGSTAQEHRKSVVAV